MLAIESSSLNHLRPLSLGEILDHSLRLYRRNFLAFAGAAAIVMLPLNLVQFFLMLFMQLMQSQALTSENSAQYLLGSLAVLGGSGATGLINVVLTVIAQTAVSRAAADAYLGQSSGALKAYRRLAPIAGDLTVLVVLVGALSIGLSFWGILVPCVGWLTGPAALIFLYAAIAPLSSVVITLERHTPINVLRRAWEMARQRFWWMLGFSLVLGLLRMAISFGPTALIQWISLSWLSNPDSLMQTQILSTVVSAVTGLFITIFMTPLVAVAFTLVYFDFRVRYEGLDLLAEARGPVRDVAEITALGVPPPGELLRTQDMANLAKVSLAAIGLYIAFVAAFMGLIFIFAGLAGGY